MMQWKQLKCPERLGAGERGGDAARAESGATSECAYVATCGCGFRFLARDEFTTCSLTESKKSVPYGLPAVFLRKA